MKNADYFKLRDEKNIFKLRELRLELPMFCSPFFVGIEHTTTPLTRLGYGRDLKIFFEFLTTNIDQFIGKNPKDLQISDLEKINSSHLEMFLDYLTVYKSGGKTYRNGNKAKSRKMSSIRALLRYYFKKEQITSNVATIVDTPKIPENEIIRLEGNEMSKLLDLVENGSLLTKREKAFHRHTKKRDLAIMSLFLGTGIRISECVGLNIEDIDLDNNAFVITRKGGSRVILYFNNEVKAPLVDYLEQRKTMKVDEKERALFLSLQNNRLGVRSVEKLVEKYANYITPLKKITPHKLRSTFGTNLYEQTNDIYIVADVLGHKDVNTTRKHYAAISDDIRRKASSKVKLRED